MISSTPAADSGRPRLGPLSTTNTRSVSQPAGRSSRRYAATGAKNRSATGTSRRWAALAVADEHAPLGRLEVLQAQRRHLTATQAAKHHRLDHGAVPHGAQHGEQGVDSAGVMIRGKVLGVRISGAPRVRTVLCGRRVVSPRGTGLADTPSLRATR